MSHSNGNGPTASETTPAARPQKEVHELVGAIRRMYRALGRRFQNNFADTADLEEIRALRDEYENLIEVAVRALREGGYSDSQIAESLRVQQPAVTKRYRRATPREPSADPRF